MPKCNTVKEVAEKVADNGNGADYIRTPIGADAEHIDRSNGETVEDSLIKLENLKLKYEDPFLMLLDKNEKELSRVTIISTKHEHKYTEEITKEATCAETGIKIFTCACGDSYTEEIPIDNSKHNFVDGICSICGKEDNYEYAPVSACANWDYTLDDANKTITLNKYTGNETDVIVYGDYVVDGEIYKTKFDNFIGTSKNKNNIQTIKFSPVIDTSNVKSMNSMFSDCSSLTSIDLSNFNTANVADMSSVFSSCSSLTSIDLSNFNTANVADMAYMFHGCSSLTSIDLSNFDTSNVKRMCDMFSGCKLLDTIALSNFDTSNVTDMSRMFRYCMSLTSLNLNNFNTSNVTNMECMFQMCEVLSSLDLSSFSTDNAIKMGYMFNYCTNLTTIYVSRDKWITSQADISKMFDECGTSEVTYK